MMRKLSLLAACLAAPLVACQSKPQQCDQDFFREQVWAPILAKNCITCHNVAGQAKDTGFLLKPATQPDYLETNLEAFKVAAQLEVRGKGRRLLLKPTLQESHEGGKRFEINSESYKAFSAMLDRLDHPAKTSGIACADFVSELNEVELTNNEETLRKATLALAGRIPTDAELELVKGGSVQTLDPVLDEVMKEDAFYDHMREAFNDHILTDAFMQNGSFCGGGSACDVIRDYRAPNNGAFDYPAAYFWEGMNGSDPAVRHGNTALAREPLELMIHVLAENRPFSEVLTADYIMLNPFSARSYGVNLSFTNAEDPREWKEGRIQNMPHSGLLTSHIYLAKYPTTETNRNRKRARFVLKQWLATDVLRDFDRPVDVSNITDTNPTMNNANCAACHGQVDPLAGAFQDWGNSGRRISADRRLFEDMRPPGWGDEAIPADQRADAVGFIADRIVKDPRFVAASVRLAYKAVTGQNPLEVPTDALNPNYSAYLKAFEVQSAVFRTIGEDFDADNMNFKTAIKSVVKSPLFRARAAAASSVEQEAILYDVGTANLVTPEQMQRKLRAITGYGWEDRNAQGEITTNYLTDGNWYRIPYGGIDSNEIETRMKAPNGLMANVVLRMANEMSCRTTAQDFYLPIEQRRLFRYVERQYQPEDASGFTVQGSVDKIKQNIQYLHWRVLGERLEIDDPEVQRTYDVFLETWREGRSALRDNVPENQDGYSNYLRCGARENPLNGEDYPQAARIENDSEYTIRAWMAVMTYLMSDPKFIIE